MPIEPRVVHVDTLDETEARYPAPWDTEPLAFGRDVGTAAGAERLGVWRDRIPPGRQTSFLHAHLCEEEAIYVLSGAPVLVWRAPGGPIRETPLTAQDYVAFPAASGLAHCLRNPDEATEDAVVLVIGERRPTDRLAYPERPWFEARRTDQFPERTWPDAEGPDGSAKGMAYRVETPRLILRPLEPEDVWPLVRLVRENQPRLAPWFLWAKTVPTIDDQLAWIKGRRVAYDTDADYNLGVFTRSGQLVGGGGVHLRAGPGVVEFGYWVGEAFEGTGVVTEWVRALTRLSLEVLGYERCLIRSDVNNTRSIAIPKKLAYARLHLETGACIPGDIVRDIEGWELAATDLAGSPSADAPVRAWDAAGRRLI